MHNNAVVASLGDVREAHLLARGSDGLAGKTYGKLSGQRIARVDLAQRSKTHPGRLGVAHLTTHRKRIELDERLARMGLTSTRGPGHARAVRTVFLLRHGKSSWSDATLRDIDRPLAPRGARASRRIAGYIRRQKVRPALVLCSPSLRTRQTLEAIGPALGKRCAVELVPELYAASEEELLERLRALPNTVGSVMIIGHNPGLQSLALTLASRGDELPKLAQKFPTGALATLTVRTEKWHALAAGAAELVAYIVPRELA